MHTIIKLQIQIIIIICNPDREPSAIRDSFQDADKNVYCAVKISTDYKGDVTTATWTDLELPVRADGASWNFVNVGVVDLSAYVGNVARLAFVYYVPDESPVGPTWEFKNILVNEKE